MCCAWSLAFCSSVDTCKSEWCFGEQSLQSGLFLHFGTQCLGLKQFKHILCARIHLIRSSTSQALKRVHETNSWAPVQHGQVFSFLDVTMDVKREPCDFPEYSPPFLSDQVVY